MRNIANKSIRLHKICVQIVQKLVGVFVYNTRAYTHYAFHDIHAQKLSPIPSTARVIPSTVYPPTFHIPPVHFLPVNAQLSSQSTGITIITTTYI